VTCVLVIEHLPDVVDLFEEVARVLEPGGVCALVMNHPAYTAAGAGPVVDMSDGEILWRWGAYFEQGSAPEPAGEGSVVFHHRPLSEVLNAAASGGLILERLDERGFSPEAIARDPALIGQEHFPRLLGVRWRAAR
jgi:SAM-dependent methyltransferase